MNKHLAGALVVAATKIPMSQLQAQEAPQIFAGANGEIEATFNNNCVVYYRANGERREANSNCSRGQVERADTGVGAYRREQGAEAMPVAKRLPVDSAIPTSTSARLKLSWTITGERMFSSDRAVSYIMAATATGMTRIASAARAKGERPTTRWPVSARNRA